MSAVPDPRGAFRELERRLEAEPEGITGEIARGVYAMSPRPRPRHGSAQGRIFGWLDAALGRGAGNASPDWYFVVEPELRLEVAFSRLVPDVAAWRRSTTGWPDPDATPVSLMPESVAEVLSPSTAAFDRGEKFEAYRHIPTLEEYVLVAPRERRVEVFRRTPGWTAQPSQSESIRIECLDLSLALEQMFEGLD
jgi:Uma2 family endonuclease